MLDTNSTCKLFAFDIDLEKVGWLPKAPLDTNIPEEQLEAYYTTDNFIQCNPREAWRDRKHPGRSWMKVQFKMIAAKFMQVIHDELEIPCAAVYSGNKGIHVYGFTGLMPAADAREGARIVLDTIGDWVPSRGVNFFKHKDQDPVLGYPNISIEVFPKQDSLDGKDLGNLMRLPLGKNMKNPKDPTFFIDMTTPMAQMSPIDPIRALGNESPWRRPGE